MTERLDIASGAVAPKTSKTPRFPPAYGRYLEDCAKTAGLDRKDLARLTDLDEQTIYRNFAGRPQRSVLSANKIRAAIVARGVQVDPVPTEADGWNGPAPRVDGAKRLSGPAETFRRNLVRFREEAGLVELHDASAATGIPFETLRAYELGEQEPSGGHLITMSRVYDRPAVDFELEEPPPRKRRPPPSIHTMVIGDLNDMTPENRARAIELQRELRALNAAERARFEEETPRPTSRKRK